MLEAATKRPFSFAQRGITMAQLAYAYKIDYVNYSRWINVEKLGVPNAPLLKAGPAPFLGA